MRGLFVIALPLVAQLSTAHSRSPKTSSTSSEGLLSCVEQKENSLYREGSPNSRHHGETRASSSEVENCSARAWPDELSLCRVVFLRIVAAEADPRDQGLPPHSTPKGR